MWYEDAIKKMLNRKIKSVVLADDKSRISFEFLDGYKQAFNVVGDCCSTSWIEHLEMPDNIVGAELTGFDENSFPGESKESYEYIQVYQSHFHTDKGDITLEYRNSSNGYYGGSLHPLEEY